MNSDWLATARQCSVLATSIPSYFKCNRNILFSSKLQLIDCYLYQNQSNKANLRDLIAATGLVISNWIQIVNFSALVTVKFDGWPCKTIGHLFYATSSFVHLFVPIGEFKLKLQSGNAQSGQIRRFLEPCNLEIWRMTLQNNRAPLLWYFKLCASFLSHWWF